MQIGKSRSVEAKQFLGFIGCVEEQIARATAITDYLHRFAHRMDCGCVSVHINELIEELIALMTRLAYRKRITFEKDLRGGLPSAAIKPILLHYLMFCIIDSRMSGLDRSGIIRVATSFSGGRLCIVVSSKGEVVQTGAAEACSNEEISGLAAQLGAEVSKNSGETVIKLPVTA